MPHLPPMKIGSYSLSFDHTLIMGILNLTPDSFSDGGIYLDPDMAVDHAKQMVTDGADIIDIGGESSRPGSTPVSKDEELNRVLPVIKRLHNEVKVPLSIDTYKPAIARACLDAGATILNDITGLTDPEMVCAAADSHAPVVMMHMKGSPRTMQANPVYQDVVNEVSHFFSKQINVVRSHGVEQIILDPGIGFGKTLHHNLLILRHLDAFTALGCPVLVGPSRKNFIGVLTGQPIHERLEGTIAAVVAAVLNGANIVRVHDVRACKRAVQVADAIRGTP
jgi:dihydropteroate synthase